MELVRDQAERNGEDERGEPEDEVMQVEDEELERLERERELVIVHTRADRQAAGHA